MTKEIIDELIEALKVHIAKSERKGSVKSIVTCNVKNTSRVSNAIKKAGISAASIVIEPTKYLAVDTVGLSYESLSFSNE